MSHMVDKKITDALLNGTEDCDSLKDMVWTNIENELDLKIKNKKNKHILSYLTKYSTIATTLIILLTIGLSTEYGSATVNKIKSFFLPSKTLNQSIEGYDTDTKVNLKESSMNYIIYIDEERYVLQHINGKDKITTKNKLTDVPEVYMEIEQIKDKKPELIASQIEKDLNDKYKNVKNEGSVSTPINSIYIHASSGTDWNSVVEKYYLINNTKGGTFIVKQQLFLIAEEGHGERLNNMLKEFKIVAQ